MSTSSNTVSGASRLGATPKCKACGAGASLWFSWSYANERGSTKDMRNVKVFIDWRALRHGKLCNCSLCGEVWHLDEAAERMTHVLPERLPLIREWNIGASTLLDADSAIVQRIGPTPPDIFGNGREKRVTPCQVVTHSGERFEKAMICVQTDAPVDNYMRFRLGSEIAEVSESPFALPRPIREASSQAEEVRMGFCPTLIAMPDGSKFVMNGMTSFMVVPGYTASEARIVGGSYFTEYPAPRFVEMPSDIVYFIVDGHPGWDVDPPTVAMANSPYRAWWRRLFS